MLPQDELMPHDGTIEDSLIHSQNFLFNPTTQALQLKNKELVWLKLKLVLINFIYIFAYNYVEGVAIMYCIIRFYLYRFLSYREANLNF